jgi:type I restriction enzyme R subunit
MKRRKSGDSVKVINLIKSIERVAEDSSDDPFLVAMADRARAVQEQFEQRQTGTAEALEELLGEVRRNEARKKEQAERGFDGLTHFVFERLQAFGVADAETVSRNIKEAFIDDPNWQHSEKSLRELRKKVTFAIFAQCEDLAEVPRLVEELFRVLERSGR